ncbi:MAG TPA: hypothetical protein VH025_05010 [Solirubrobacteraceae bacterium]|jgi:hypothetical protein|nr:hypothetical protein [Solirubrobacteraceae bacterium]
MRVRHAALPRVLIRALLALSALSALAAAPAAAAVLSTGCSGLQAAINTASSQADHGEGEVIALSEMCTATNLKSSAGVTIPESSNITIEAAPGTTAGIDGAGIEESLLRTTGTEPAGTLAIRNLTFSHADITGSAGAALRLFVSHVTLANDSFLENSLRGGVGGAVEIFLSPPGGKPVCQSAPTPSGVTLTNSVFRGNTLTGAGNPSGGALEIAQICQYPQSVLEGDVFEGNKIEAGPSSSEALGGAFAFEPGGESPTPLLQRGNVFDSNQILSASTTAEFGGGGEWTEGASLTSAGDRFSRNSIAGAGASRWSWGGGLGILNSSCEPTESTESTLENAVVTGNSIGAGAGDLGGGGIYVGCGPAPEHPNHLALLDSTVTENTVPSGGVAGIDGHGSDQLTLTNTIVAADIGGQEIGGFNGAGGALTASFSDVCDAGGAAPPAGEGNICANPLLADNGNPASVDVHETASSPTRLGGSAALVPAGMTTDFYGGERRRSYVTPTCGAEGPPHPVLDIGADQETPPVVALPCAPPVVIDSAFGAPAVTVRQNGRLMLLFHGLRAGRLQVTATSKVTRLVTVSFKGKRRRVRRTHQILYAQSSRSVAAATSTAFVIAPTRQALATLKSHKHLTVTITITFTATGARHAAKHSKTLSVTYRRPPAKRNSHR